MIMNAEKMIMNAEKMIMNAEKTIMDAEKTIMNPEKIITNPEKMIMDAQKMITDSQKKDLFLRFFVSALKSPRRMPMKKAGRGVWGGLQTGTRLVFPSLAKQLHPPAGAVEPMVNQPPRSHARPSRHE
jgi:hypothetical protein